MLVRSHGLEVEISCSLPKVDFLSHRALVCLRPMPCCLFQAFGKLSLLPLLPTMLFPVPPSPPMPGILDSEGRPSLRPTPRSTPTHRQMPTNGEQLLAFKAHEYLDSRWVGGLAVWLLMERGYKSDVGQDMLAAMRAGVLVFGTKI